MKRLLLIFLLTMLPLQISWAAVTGYCQHEEGKAAQHFGHHEHKHQATADDTQKSKSLLTIDTDCGFCQLSGVGIINMSSDAVPAGFHHVAPAFTNTDFLACIRPERPERPKWVSAV